MLQPSLMPSSGRVGWVCPLLGLVLLASSLAWCRQAQSDLLPILLCIGDAVSILIAVWSVARLAARANILEWEDWSLELQCSGAAQTPQSVQLCGAGWWQLAVAQSLECFRSEAWAQKAESMDFYSAAAHP